jgi:hypothetical protein
MNWGNKLLLVFVVFGSGISYMVYRCMRTPVDLVSAEYYKDELAYQHVIDGTRQADALSGKVQLVSMGGRIRLLLPAEMRDKPVTGTIQFYCPYDETRDRNIPLHADAEGVQDIPPGQVTPGNYTVKVSWETGSTGYYHEQSFSYP